MREHIPEAQALLDRAIRLSDRMQDGRLSADVRITPLSPGGSPRRFFRLRENGRTAVLLWQRGGSAELESYVVIGNFLNRQGIGVPEIYGFDPLAEMILMEDLGDVHLEDVLAGSSREEEISLYRQCIEILIALETKASRAMERDGILEGKIFDRSVLIGETDYFVREFIGGYCNVPLPAGWEGERLLLAETLAKEQQVFMHRDFQCRNILVKDGRLRLIDFQTAHRGPGLYDAASLLKDPYHPVGTEERRVLLRDLFDGLEKGGAERGRSFEQFSLAFTMAGVQRNLQALAAYARLGLREGKSHFLDSIPSGLDLLEEGVTTLAGFQAIREMITAIREAI